MKLRTKLLTSITGITTLSCCAVGATSCSTKYAPTPEPEVVNFTVQFELGEGHIEGLTGNSMVVNEGTTYGLLPTPKLAGFTFDGWKVGGNDVALTDIIQDNLTVEAKWVETGEQHLYKHILKCQVRDLYNIRVADFQMHIVNDDATPITEETLPANIEKNVGVYNVYRYKSQTSRTSVVGYSFDYEIRSSGSLFLKLSYIYEENDVLQSSHVSNTDSNLHFWYLDECIPIF